MCYLQWSKWTTTFVLVLFVNAPLADFTHEEELLWICFTCSLMALISSSFCSLCWLPFSWSSCFKTWSSLDMALSTSTACKHKHEQRSEIREQILPDSPLPASCCRDVITVSNSLNEKKGITHWHQLQRTKECSTEKKKRKNRRISFRLQIIIQFSLIQLISIAPFTIKLSVGALLSQKPRARTCR